MSPETLHENKRSSESTFIETNNVISVRFSLFLIIEKINLSSFSFLRLQLAKQVFIFNRSQSGKKGSFWDSTNSALVTLKAMNPNFGDFCRLCFRVHLRLRVVYSKKCKSPAVKERDLSRYFTCQSYIKKLNKLRFKVYRISLLNMKTKALRLNRPSPNCWPNDAVDTQNIHAELKWTSWLSRRKNSWY